MIRRLFLCALLWTPLASLRAEEASIPAPELARDPAPGRINAVLAQAAAQGWSGQVRLLRDAAIGAYESGSGAAPAWYYLYRSAALLGTPQERALAQWIEAIQQAKLGHSGMALSYTAAPGVLADCLAPEMQRFFLGTPAFAEEFFLTFKPVDNPAAVLGILQTLYAADPARFLEYQNLAIAIAVVYDVPPPPGWPHGQVSASALPRRLPAPTAAFAYWSNLDRINISMQRLRRLPASELKFLVDVAAPFSELDWARHNVGPGLAEFARAYDLVHYRKERLVANAYLWPLRDYRLETIQREGGICVDQAYFASTAGKAKGIPTIMFRGAGLDGRHAWFGYLDGQGKWQNDCGRYAEQKFVVGLAFDPQTWGDINDHELSFLAERFRALPTYRLSVLHAQFAAEYLHDGKPVLALRAARESVNRERRNLDGWQILVQAQRAVAPGDLRALEGVQRQAILTFQNYPDLETFFSRQLADTLRLRGETSAASFEEQRVARKYQEARTDISIQQAAEMMARSLAKEAIPAQIRTYQVVLENYGRGGGVDFYDKVVRPFALHLLAEGQKQAALTAVDRARQYLRIERGSQLDGELANLMAQLRRGKN